jgi:hypothetical protein
LTGAKFDAAFDELTTMVKHITLISIDDLSKTVTFATFTHSTEIVGQAISGITKPMSLVDFRLDPRIQYISETTSRIPLQIFIQALNDSSIYLSDVAHS